MRKASLHQLHIDGIGYVKRCFDTINAKVEPVIAVYRGTCSCKEWIAYTDSAYRVRVIFDHEHYHKVTS